MTEVWNNWPGGLHFPPDGPVMEIDADHLTKYPNGDELPDVRVSEPVLDGEGNMMFRAIGPVYPYDDSDTDGSDALWHGAQYYTEAMGYTDPADHDRRIDCFRAAEILYRHAAGRGEPIANLNLGYVYSYDRCEGQYWQNPDERRETQDGTLPYPREKRAFECLKLAAEADIAEACYKLGDLCKRGMGCEPDAAAAFKWYVRASELSQHESPVILGSVALRLGECYEEGIGCQQDFARALKWYRRAVDGLDAAVDAGEAWYEKALACARAGVKRCQQEV